MPRHESAQSTSFLIFCSSRIIAALGASGMPALNIFEGQLRLKKSDFWDPDPWYRVALHGLRLFRGWHGYLDGERFADLLQRMLPVASFGELSDRLAVTRSRGPRTGIKKPRPLAGFFYAARCSVARAPSFGSIPAGYVAPQTRISSLRG